MCQVMDWGQNIEEQDAMYDWTEAGQNTQGVP